MMNVSEKFNIMSGWLRSKGLSLTMGTHRDYVQIGGHVELVDKDITDIPFPFDILSMGLTVVNCKVKDLSFLPRMCGYQLTLSLPQLPIAEYRRVLLTSLPDGSWNGRTGRLSIAAGRGEEIDDQLIEILMKGRIETGSNDHSSLKGSMPSELIPGKIKQIRDL